MVRAFAGDSTMTSLPRPAPDVERDLLEVVVRLAALPAARRGLALVASGIVIEGLHAERVVSKLERLHLALAGAEVGTGRNLRHRIAVVSRRTGKHRQNQGLATAHCALTLNVILRTVVPYQAFQLHRQQQRAGLPGRKPGLLRELVDVPGFAAQGVV